MLLAELRTTSAASHHKQRHPVEGRDARQNLGDGMPAMRSDLNAFAASVVVRLVVGAGLHRHDGGCAGTAAKNGS